ncbi:hypothetical protein Tco_0842827 [Tanacetum coccineum]|uniref:Uncharacterized protein n=1 Tax=Tanacetum coccineum TaxID=301880 RepID=A0ABQ5B0W2_9ASTR
MGFHSYRRPWFSSIGYNGEIGATRTLKKSRLPPRFFHFHSKSASRCDASADSIAKVDRTNPSVLVDKTKSAEDGLKTSHTDLDTRSSFFTPDSLYDEPIIVSDESEEEETKRYKDTHTTSHNGPEDTSIPHPPSPKSLEQKKAKAEAEVAFLKARPSYPDITQLTELLVAELKTLQWELPTEFLGLPSQISSVQEKLKTLYALPSLLHKVTDTLNRFATIVENASSKATDEGVPSAGHTNASPAEGEKNINQATKDVVNANLNQQPTTTTPPTTSFQSPLFPKSKGKEVMSSIDAEDEETESDFEDDHANLAKIVKSELVDLMGIDAVTQYYNKKLMYDKYCDKVLKRRKGSKITNCDVITTKGPITLKVYREDRTNEVISNLKTRIEYLDQTKKELKIDFNRPLKEQDPLDELNDLANKKRKRADDLKDHSKSTKKHKSSVQHEKEVH